MNNTNVLSNGDHLVSLINFLNKTISEIGFAFILLLGNIGSILMCIIFTQPTYRNTPCAMFFFAASLSQFFTYNFALFTRMLHYGYDIRTLNYNLWYCKIRFYLFYIFVAVPRYYIILASIDRYFASSRNALRRRWSSPKTALRLIIANVLFWSLIYIQVLVFYETNTGSCSYRSSGYGIFFSIYIAIDSGILPLLLMLIFGLLTVRNIHKTKMRIGGNQRGRISKKDVQLHRMLANQIVLYLILNLPNPCFLVYYSFALNMSKSAVQIAAESWASNMTYLLVYLGFSLTFVNFMISSDIFRQEFFCLFQRKILRRRIVMNRTVGQSTVLQTAAQNDTNV
ncbi:unnamed protein product [Adineta ricciae]|uniref:G-protein coupled receptors family 1 profile domain-containing protein n=1 Tax=Adineta ricciae TaxID=249248 RepID=A0A815GEE9_ADIRI|nr:unnamed protein product [Adineta ricciae]